MKNNPSKDTNEKPGKIEDLVRLIRETEKELQVLTGGGIDAITQLDGKPYLLSEAQERLRTSEAKQRQTSETQTAILNALPAEIALLDGQGFIIAVNDSWKKFSSIHLLQNSEFFIGKNYLQICETARGDGAETAHETAVGIRNVLSGEIREFSLEYFCRTPAKKYWFQLIVTPLNEKENKGVVVTHLDISERKMAEQSLIERDSLLQMAGKMARLGGWSVSYPDGNISWSDEVCAIHEVPPGTVPELDEAIGFYTPESKKSIIPAFDSCIQEGKPFDLELELITARGNKIWVRSTGKAERDKEGRIIRVQGAFQDISDRKTEEVKLERSNRALKMLSACNEALIHSDEESFILNEICKITVETGGYAMAWVGYAGEDKFKTVIPIAQFGSGVDYLGKVDISWDENLPIGQGPAGITIRSGKTMVVPEIEKESSFAPWQKEADKHGFKGVVCLPLKDKVKTFGLLILYSSSMINPSKDDIRLLEELADDLAFGISTLRNRKEKEQVQNLVLNIAKGVSSSIGLKFFDRLAENLVQALSADVGAIALLEPEPGKAKTVTVIIDGKKSDNFEYDSEGTPCEIVINGDICAVEKEASKIYPRDLFMVQMGIEAYFGVPLNNSENKTIGILAVQYRKSNSRTDFIISTLQIFAARASAELERQKSDIQVHDQAALLDSAREAILAKDLEDRVIYWNKGAQKMFGWTSEEVLGKKSGEMFFADVQKFQSAMTYLFEFGEWNGELLKKKKNGEIIVTDVSWTLVRDDQGHPKSILAINSDITERKKLENQFLRAQRMESIGTMAGGIAHDLNNILAPIMITADILKMEVKDPEHLDLIENIKLSSKRGAEMVKQVLAFSRGFEGPKVKVNVTEIISDLNVILKDTFPKNIQIEVVAEAGLWPVLADPGQLNQVILNLCVNARDAMPNGGTITIQTENKVLDPLYAHMNPGSKSGPYITIKITDTGDGIPQEIQERIFDPFFTTKEIGKGTGLGLSTVLGIVKSLDGFIHLYSEMGKGATFKVYFPANAKDGEIVKKDVETLSLPGGNGELILVVDDEEVIRLTVKNTLERFGYKVKVASHGAEALAIYSKIGSAISVVITDMSMPIMDGPATIIALKSLNPEVVIIGSSGLHLNGNIGKVVGAGVKYFIGKPYTAEAILKTLDQAIKELSQKKKV